MGSITGIFYVDFGSTRFPEEGWSDFPVIVTTWWLEALAKLKQNFPLCQHDVRQRSLRI